MSIWPQTFSLKLFALDFSAAIFALDSQAFHLELEALKKNSASGFQPHAFCLEVSAVCCLPQAFYLGYFFSPTAFLPRACGLFASGARDFCLGLAGFFPRALGLVGVTESAEQDHGAGIGGTG